MGSETGGSKAAAGDPASARGILTTTKERVAEILEATDRAAAEIMEAANRESEQLVRDTHLRAERLATERMERISSLTEGVMAKAATLDRELDQLRALIDEALEALAKDLGLDEADEAAPAERQAEPDTTATEASTPTPDEERADALQLLATQLLISGETFESASRRMAEEFGVQNPRFVLDSLDFKAIGR